MFVCLFVFTKKTQKRAHCTLQTFSEYNHHQRRDPKGVLAVKGKLSPWWFSLLLHLPFILLDQLKPILHEVQKPSPHLYVDVLFKTQVFSFLFSCPQGNLWPRVPSRAMLYTRRQTSSTSRPTCRGGKVICVICFLYLGNRSALLPFCWEPCLSVIAILCLMESPSILVFFKPLNHCLFFALIWSDKEWRGTEITDTKAEYRERGEE